MFRVGTPSLEPFFPEIHNNNNINNINNNVEKPEQKNRGGDKRGCGGMILTLNIFMVFMNRKTLN